VSIREPAPNPPKLAARRTRRSPSTSQTTRRALRGALWVEADDDCDHDGKWNRNRRSDREDKPALKVARIISAQPRWSQAREHNHEDELRERSNCDHASCGSSASQLLTRAPDRIRQPTLGTPPVGLSVNERVPATGADDGEVSSPQSACRRGAAADLASSALAHPSKRQSRGRS